MIRATTGRPARIKVQDEPLFRPSSAKGKLQSHAYSSLVDEIRSSVAVSQVSSVIPVEKNSATDDSCQVPKPLLGKC